MNYYLPQYDVPLVLGYTGPGLSSYSQDSKEIGDLIPSFLKQEDLITRSKSLESQTPRDSNDPINTFFLDEVAMMRATLENIVSQIEERRSIKEEASRKEMW